MNNQWVVLYTIHKMFDQFYWTEYVSNITMIAIFNENLLSSEDSSDKRLTQFCSSPTCYSTLPQCHKVQIPILSVYNCNILLTYVYLHCYNIKANWIEWRVIVMLQPWTCLMNDDPVQIAQICITTNRI